LKKKRKKKGTQQQPSIREERCPGKEGKRVLNQEKKEEEGTVLCGRREEKENYRLRFVEVLDLKKKKKARWLANKDERGGKRKGPSFSKKENAVHSDRVSLFPKGEKRQGHCTHWGKKGPIQKKGVLYKTSGGKKLRKKKRECKGGLRKGGGKKKGGPSPPKSARAKKRRKGRDVSRSHLA